VLTFNISSDNAAAFASGPSIDEATGNLSYELVEHYGGGPITVTVSLSDDGGTANGGVEQSADQTFTIEATPVADGVNLTLNADVVNVGDDGLAVPPPASTGLLLSYYQALNNTDRDAALQEGVIDPASATSRTRQISGFGTPETDGLLNQNISGTTIDIVAGDSYSVTGLIFLEEGKSYVFSGYQDDSMRIELGGEVLYTTGNDTWGDYSTVDGSAGTGATANGAFVATASGYYTFEAFVNNVGGPGDFSLNASVDGGDPQVLSGDNFSLYASVTDLIKAGGQFNTFVSHATNTEAGYFPPVVNVGVVDSYIEISNISPLLIDNDDSEILNSITINVTAMADDSSNPVTVPAISITDGSNVGVIPAGTSGFELLGWDLNNIRLLPPEGFAGTIDVAVTASSIEVANSEVSSSTTQTVQLTVQDLTSTVDDLDPDLLDTDAVLEGTDGNDTLQSNIIVAASNDVTSIIETTNTYQDPNAFDFTFTGGEEGVYISSLTIDISADNNARFDMNGNNSYGPVVDVLSDVVTTEVSFNDGTDTSVLTATFDAGTFVVGESFYFGVDTDGHGPGGNTNAGGAFGSEDATLTINFSDGSSQTVTYGRDSNDKSTASISAAGVGSVEHTILDGGDGNDTITGSAESDFLIGGLGDDTLGGEAGNDALHGGEGIDTLIGGDGEDILFGDTGNDTLTGDDGVNFNEDQYVWQQADTGAVDTITDFSAGGVDDILNLKDLLQGEDAGNLTDYLEVTDDTVNTTIHIDVDGDNAPGVADQIIVLEGTVLDLADLLPHITTDQ